MSFSNLSDDTVRIVVQSLSSYVPTKHLEGVLMSLDAAVADATSSAGGTVDFADITGKPATYPPVIGTTATTAKAGNYTPPNATSSTRGIVLQGVAVANAAAAPTQAEFNALLASLRTAGVLAT